MFIQLQDIWVRIFKRKAGNKRIKNLELRVKNEE